jgi:hypothetical protein
MNSGIGDSEELSAIGIEPLVNLPSVGKNMTEHPGVVAQWLVNSTETYDTILRNQTLFDDLLQEWQDNKTGVFVDPPASQAAWLRLPDNSSVLAEYGDPSSGNASAHFELIFQVSFSYTC